MARMRTIAVLLLVTACSATGQMMHEIAGDGADVQLQEDGSTRWVGGTSQRVGWYNVDGTVQSTNSIYVFQLPALTPDDTITGAHLSFDLVGGSWFAPVGAVDAYGLSWRASPTPLASDFYVGPYGGDTTDAAPIQHALAVPAWSGGQAATCYGTYGTDAAGDQALAAYLNAQYAAGAVGGNYVFIRLGLEEVQPLEAFFVFNSGNSTPPVTLTVVVNGGTPDQMPAADAGDDQSVSDDDADGSEMVTLDGAGSSDADGTIVAYDWAEDDATIATGQTPQVTLAIGVHTITLTVTDNDGYADSDTVTIEVIDPFYNEPPTADAGPNQTVRDDDENGSEAVTLDGTGSSDADGTIVDCAWAVDGSPLAAGATPTVTLARGQYAITLTVTDDDDATDADTVTIDVIDPAAGLMNLPAPTADRFTITDKVWPATPGEAHVCLWADDALAAVSITVDDNNAGDHAWWMQTLATYSAQATWFVITGLVTPSGGYFGSWADFEALRDAGQEMQSHTITHLAFERGFDPDDPEHDIRVEYAGSQAEIENRLGVRCQTLAYPGGANTIYNDRDIAGEYYIAARGTAGTVNPVNHVDYMYTNSVGNGLVVSNPSAPWAQLINIFDPAVYRASNYRAWYVTHYHGLNDDLKAQIIEALAFLQQKDAEVGVWIAPFRQAAQYGQERDSATLTVTAADATGVAFTLTDLMINQQYDYPLTVKVRMFDTWDAVEATQDGQAVKVAVVEHDGAKFALVEAVPDRGQVLLAPVSAARPGDADEDGDVDLDDFVILKTAFGMHGPDLSADFDDDGDVDLDDFVILKSHFGAAD